jgi:tungstate transport system ATP-binding protein
LPEINEPVIEARGLKRDYYGRTVVDVEHLAVGHKEVLAVLGPSGSGKSVLLRILNLLEQPTRGTIRFRGREVQGLEGRDRVGVSRRMAMVFQDPLLFRGTVEENVAYGLKVRRLPADQIEERVGEMLEVVNLAEYAGSRVSTLSGGEAQRVAVARALVIKPEVLFFDEPFANLDLPTRHALQRESKAILRERDMTAVFVTHDQEEAARMGDRILVLHDGQVAQEGTARDIFYSPRTEFVARFVGVDNIYRGEVLGVSDGLARVSVDGAVFEVTAEAAAGEKVTLGLRPEDVTLILPEAIESPASSRNVFLGEVTGIELRGPVARVMLACPFPLVVIVTRRSLEDMGVALGSRFGVRFKATAVVVI